MVFVGFLLFSLLILLLLYQSGLVRSARSAVVCILLTAGTFAIRYFMMDHVTLDYQDFLKVWVDYFRDNGGFQALNRSIGNYNVPYLYFLAAFSYFENDLYLIKLLSILFDIFLAYYSMRIVSRFTGSTGKKLAVFFAVLYLPTVILNGSRWGQCDSIYTAFAVMSVCYALEGKPVRSVAAIALSFAFKLQAIFIMPVFFLFLLAKRIRVQHLLVFPATYIAVILPAVLLGRPFWSTFTLYYNQADTVGTALNYNSSSAYAFLQSYPESLADRYELYGIAVAAAFILLIFILAIVRRKSLSDKALLCASALFAVAVPFFLPHMHDRYFFMADILVLVFAFVYEYHFAAPVLVSFASLLGYAAYFLRRYVLPMKYGATALAVVILLITAQLVYELLSKRPRRKGS